MIVEKNWTISEDMVNGHGELKNQELLEILTYTAGAHSAMVGNSAEEFKKKNLAWVVLVWKVEIKKRPQKDDNILIKTWVRPATGIYSVRDFEAYDEDGRVILRASSKWCIMNLETRRPTRFEKELSDAYAPEDKKVFEEDFDKVKVFEDFDSESEYIVSEKDIDGNHHFHNANYLDAAYTVIENFDYTRELFNEFQMEFKKEIMLGETVKVLLKNENEKKIIALKVEDKINAIITLK